MAQEIFIQENAFNIPSSRKDTVAKPQLGELRRPVTTIRVNEVYPNRGRKNSVSRLLYQEAQLAEFQALVEDEFDRLFTQEKVATMPSVVEQALEVVAEAERPRGLRNRVVKVVPQRLLRALPSF